MKTYSLEHVEGWGGVGKVVFTARIAAGKGERVVAVEVPPKVIHELARLLALNPNGTGHAVWHYNSNEVQAPCSSCEIHGPTCPDCGVTLYDIGKGGGWYCPNADCSESGKTIRPTEKKP